MTDNQVGANEPHQVGAGAPSDWAEEKAAKISLEIPGNWPDTKSQKARIEYIAAALREAYEKGREVGSAEQRKKDAEIAEAWLDGFGELSLGERIKEEILSQSVVQGAASAPERDDTKEPK